MNHLPTSPAVPMWREMSVFRAFLYITFMVPSKESTLQIPLTGLPPREMLRFRSPPSSIRAAVHAPTKSVSVPEAISLLPPVQPRSGVHTHRQNWYRRLQGGQFREWSRAINMAPMWNRRFYLLCLLHLRRRRRLKRREREFWEHPIVAARTLEGAYYTLYGRLREDERKFFNYFRMSTSTFDYIVIVWLLISNARTQWCGKAFVHGKCLQ